MFQMVGKKSGDSRRATAINRKTKRGNNDDEELPEKTKREDGEASLRANLLILPSKKKGTKSDLNFSYLSFFYLFFNWFS